MVRIGIIVFFVVSWSRKPMESFLVERYVVEFTFILSFEAYEATWPRMLTYTSAPLNDLELLTIRKTFYEPGRKVLKKMLMPLLSKLCSIAVSNHFREECKQRSVMSSGPMLSSRSSRCSG